MSTGMVLRSPNFLAFSSHGYGSHFQLRSVYVSPAMKMNPTSPQRRKETLSLEIPTTSVPPVEPSRPSDLRFDRLQDQECINGDVMNFGRFMARAAVLDEEYWTAAWLRAECHWEDQPFGRYVDSYKRKFAEQEFNALKRRSNGQYAQKCTCIIVVGCFMVKKAERNEQCTILKSVVGTLDLSIQYLLQGEEYPGEHMNAPIFHCFNRTSPRTYVYLANLCVTKSARRRGIASKMLQFAVESAKSDGVEQVFVHVHKDNMPAKELYQKMGFQVPGTEASRSLKRIVCVDLQFCMGSTNRVSYNKRLVAIVLALLAVLSPLYIDRKPEVELEPDEDGTISFISWAWLPMLLVILIVAINMSWYLDRSFTKFDPYWIHRVGGSPCGILALLVLLALVLKCKASSNTMDK